MAIKPPCDVAKRILRSVVVGPLIHIEQNDQFIRRLRHEDDFDIDSLIDEAQTDEPAAETNDALENDDLDDALDVDDIDSLLDEVQEEPAEEPSADDLIDEDELDDALDVDDIDSLLDELMTLTRC